MNYYRGQKMIGFTPCGEHYISKRFGLLRTLGLIQPGKPGRPKGYRDGRIANKTRIVVPQESDS
jgi:hypothetical protein